ncbi:leucine-rich repeat domain-containing protein [Dactylosporangium sp. NPDC005572]|uniref:leucine-rich repeat domain-containing protein n=1 Tax=Dactylosporangium sp. NPDC005572 TaxID=3156889 RepID=UPI0033A97B9D
MDPCLRLALLEADYHNDVVGEARDRPIEELKARYAELLAVEVPADADRACWTDEADLWDALPDGADGRIRALAGIDRFPGLRNLYLRESEVDDLGPLAALPGLELLWLGVPPDADLTPLLACDGLKRVHIAAAGVLHPPGHEVLAALAARGVQVDNLLPDPVAAAAPFGDPILKLAVLDTLQRTVELPPTYFFDEFEFDEDNLARLMAVAVPQAELDTVETLSWLGGGHATAHMVWAQWDGESDEFSIRSLAGVEALRNLRKLALTPLALLPERQIAQLRARGITVSEWPG